MAQQDVILTHEGLKELQEKLEYLKTVGRKETARGSQEKTFRITGFAQANPAEGKISDESPVGKALMGHKVGDKVVVEAPRGEMTYKIVKIDIESK